MKYKFFNKESLSEAVQTLQPVTPTNDTHQAHYYNEGFGLAIMIEQQNFLRAFKKDLIDCHTKSAINKLIEIRGIAPKWPPYIDKLSTNNEEIEKKNYQFWAEGFGSLIRERWFEMISNFISKINDLK